jgi:thiol-disulfide isomerase/thioredoxin
MAQGQPDQTELRNLNEQIGDPDRAANAIPRLRSLLASSADSSYTGYLRQLLLKALISSEAPAREIADAADSTVPYLPLITRSPAAFHSSVAQVLASRGEELPRAMKFARAGIAALPANDARSPGLRGFAYTSLAAVHFEAGRFDSSFTWLTMALPISPDSQTVLTAMGRSKAKLGDTDAAINYFVRAQGVFPPGDTTGSGELGALYKAKNGSLKGLDGRISTARASSAERVALAPRRFERTAPPWKLESLNGGMLDLESYKGKVVVLDFWGSWCGPCRYELPIIEALHQRYQKGDRVVFLGINWERTDDREQHLKIARDYVAKNNLTFPSVIDPNQVVANAYLVEGFPSAFIVDREGKIRYKNVGVADGIEHILEAQIESLLR